jgi:hypothetical protein
VAPGFGDELLLSPATSDVLRLFPKPRLSTGGQDTECKYAYEYESQDDVVRGQVRIDKFADCVHRCLPLAIPPAICVISKPRVRLAVDTSCECIHYSIIDADFKQSVPPYRRSRSGDRCAALGAQQGTLSAAKRSAWPGRQRDERQLVEELRVPLPDIDAGGMWTVEITEALGSFGETTVRKLLSG